MLMRASQARDTVGRDAFGGLAVRISSPLSFFVLGGVQFTVIFLGFCCYCGTAVPNPILKNRLLTNSYNTELNKPPLTLKEQKCANNLSYYRRHRVQ